MTDIQVPDGLSDRGSQLWAAITGTYALRPDELRALEDACFTADVVDRLQRALRKAPMTVKGPYGGMQAHPLLAELRQSRALVASLLGKLGLKDVAADSEALTRSLRARRAAHARWSRTPVS